MTRQAYVPKFEALAAARMVHAEQLDLRIVSFRALEAIAETPQGLAQLKAILNGHLIVPGVELRPLDRWNLVATLLAHADPEAESILAAEKRRDPSGDGQKYAYFAEAAKPQAAVKSRYFDDFMNNHARQEDWIEQSLYAFNYWNQSQLTAPYLSRALQALPQIKRRAQNLFSGGSAYRFYRRPGLPSRAGRGLQLSEIRPDRYRPEIENPAGRRRSRSDRSHSQEVSRQPFRAPCWIEQTRCSP